MEIVEAAGECVNSDRKRPIEFTAGEELDDRIQSIGHRRGEGERIPGPDIARYVRNWVGPSVFPMTGNLVIAKRRNES